jgi:putative hydrolase of the HAD superfamily
LGVIVRALILDYGGVLSMPQDKDEVRSMAARVGVSAHDFARAYMQEREGLDSGAIGVDEYWKRVLSRLSREDMASPSLVGALVEGDLDSWFKLRDETWDIAARLRGRGGRTALLTNNTVPMMARLRATGRLTTHFDVVIASCEFGVCKPAPAIFRACLEALGVDAPEVLFVDDHSPNVVAAEALGMQTLLFEGSASVARLDELVERSTRT